MSIIYTAPAWAIIVTGVTISLIIAAVVASRFTHGDTSDMVVAGSATFVLAAIFIVGIPMAMREAAGYERWCASQGGHVDSSSSSSTVVTGGGQVGVAVSTTTYCLSADGRVLDVQ